jgi:hypothetical protein
VACFRILPPYLPGGTENQHIYPPYPEYEADIPLDCVILYNKTIITV